MLGTSFYQPSNQVTYAFEEGGALRLREMWGVQTREREGTWERVGDRVRLTVVDGTTSETTEYAVGWDGPALALTHEPLVSQCRDAECLARTAWFYWVETGTLVAFRYEEEIKLRSVSIPSVGGS